jgi:ATP-dependent Clp protease adaptor protein ClpS
MPLADLKLCDIKPDQFSQICLELSAFWDRLDRRSVWMCGAFAQNRAFCVGIPKNHRDLRTSAVWNGDRAISIIKFEQAETRRPISSSRAIHRTAMSRKSSVLRTVAVSAPSASGVRSAAAGLREIVLASGKPVVGADEDRKRRGDPGAPGTAVISKTKPQTRRPSLYRVLILNDDYTPMEFVVHVLERFFNKDHESATRIMLHVHHHGIGECGIYTYEVAETKVTQVMDFARKHQHPLQCVMEKK